MEQFGPQKDRQSFRRVIIPYGMHPEKDIVLGRPPASQTLAKINNFHIYYSKKVKDHFLKRKYYKSFYTRCYISGNTSVQLS